MSNKYKIILFSVATFIIIYISASLFMIDKNLWIVQKQPVSNTWSIENEVDEFKATPTESTNTGELISENTWTLSLSGVMNSNYTYLDSENKTFNSGALKDILWKYQNTIVYFYPKDWTPNCTIQALDFSLMLNDFRSKWYNIIGVSKDNIESHLHFAELNELKIALLEDGSGELLKAFGAEWELKEYGNWSELSDIIRSTYIVKSDWTITHAFKDITAKWHARSIYNIATGEKYTK